MNALFLLQIAYQGAMPAKDTTVVRTADVKAAMDAKNMNKSQLAKLIGASPSTIGRLLENGTAGLETIRAIEKALDKPAGSFSEESAPEDGPESPITGLNRFLEQHAKTEKITKREIWYLRQSQFKAEPWVEFNDDFWRKLLVFWREYLRDQEEVSRK